MNETKMNHADFITSAVLIAFGCGVMVLSAQMPRLEEKDIDPYTAPGVVPFFLGAVITLLAVTLLVRSIIRKGWKVGIRGKFAAAGKDQHFRRLLGTLALTLVYALVLVGRLNYTVSTTLFIFAFIVVFEWKSAESGPEASKPTLGSRLKANRRVLAWAGVEAVLAAGITAAVFHYLFLVKLP